MIPWSIVLICLFYAAIASASAASIWRMAQGQLPGSWIWPGMWCGVSSVLVIGLGLLKPWARQAAVWVSVALMCVALGGAIVAVMTTPPQPAYSFMATAVAAGQCLIIRYLTRPHVKAWFAGSRESVLLGKS